MVRMGGILSVLLTESILGSCLRHAGGLEAIGLEECGEMEVDCEVKLVN